MCVGGNYLRQNWKAAFVLCIVFLGFATGKGATGSCIVGPVFRFMVLYLSNPSPKVKACDKRSTKICCSKIP